jgi:4-amino-4-deoxy-L-arabinose transferase-like glycosyltransferase
MQFGSEPGIMKLSRSINRRFDPFLIGTAILAAFLNIYGIWQDQSANAYYTAAVASMLQSWHNFFYASFDPGGFVTVDKPPVAFWLQTLSAAIFGLHGWSVILPQALAGVGTVVLIYVLVKPTFGRGAARLAALVAACTPVAAAVSRTNNVDSVLVFTLLLAAWLLFKAARTSSGGWALGAFALIGIGFNVKMLQAYMVVPAFYLFYLIAFRVSWKKKVGILAASTAVLLAVSFSWPLIVDSTPKESRPYIGSSQTNSVLELAFGYNGLNRLTGMRGSGGIFGQRQDDGGQNFARGENQRDRSQGSNLLPGQDSSNSDSYRRQADGNSFADGRQGDGGQNFRPGQNTPPGNGAFDWMTPLFGSNSQRMQMGGGFNTGRAGPLRLFQTELAGQISWLLPLALFGAVVLLLGYKRRETNPKIKETLFWLAWLLPCMAFFSIAGFFHPYYLIMLAPPIAALVGAGWTKLYGFYRRGEGWKKWLLPAALLGSTLFEVSMLTPYQRQIGWVWPLALGLAGGGLTFILVLLSFKKKLRPAVVLAGTLVLLAAPLYWTATPLLYGGNSSLPEAGPQLRTDGNRGMMQGMNQESIDSDLVAYLTQNNTGEKYLFATTDSHTAAPYIIQTGKAVMAMGGFSGSDPILTVAQMEKLVAAKQVKYFLLSSGGFGGRGSSEILEWVRANGKEIPRQEWQSAAGNSGNLGSGRNGSLTLYEVTLQ